MKLLKNTLMNIMLVASVGVLIFTGLAFFKVVTPLVVVSGSMEPVIPTGSLVISKKVPADTALEGDIASLPREDGVLVTHRVIENVPFKSDPDLREIRMKGDANSDADQNPYIASEALEPLVTIPYAGYATSFMNNNKLLIIAAACFGAALYSIYLIISPSLSRKRSSEDEKNDDGDEAQPLKETVSEHEKV